MTMRLPAPVSRRLCLASAMLLAGCNTTATLPRPTGGRAFVGRQQPRELSPAEVATVASWLQQQTRWEPLLYTPPLGNAADLCLDAAGQKDAICLTFWSNPNPTDPYRTVWLHYPANKPIGIRPLRDDDLALLMPLLR